MPYNNFLLKLLKANYLGV